VTEEASDHDLGHRVLRGYFDALTELDPEAIAGRFAEDGQLEDPVGTPLRRGRSAIADYWRKGLCAVARKVEIQTVTALPAGTSIAAHWRMTAHAEDGRVAEADGIDVLQFDARGLILRAEGYWDQQAFRHNLAG